MKGDFSRNTFNSRKHYSGVLMQQGRVQLDADWNEQLLIQHHRTETEARDVIGLCGVPKKSDAFRLDVVQDDLAVSPGRIYVDGLLCELESTSAPITFIKGQDQQVSVPLLTADGRPFQAGQWLEVSADGQPPKSVRITGTDEAQGIIKLDQSIADYRGKTNATLRRIVTYTSQPDYPSPIFATKPDLAKGELSKLQLGDGTYLAYLHVWKEHVTALDDPLIRENALGGPDTATRIKNVWQLKLLPAATIIKDEGGKEGDNNEPASCETRFEEWEKLVALSTGRMNARTHFVEDPKNPCVLPPSSGYQRLENQLYRVEIQKGGALGDATFKWSRENGSVLTSIEKINGNTLTVAEVGKDEFLGFTGGGWAEIIDDETELKGTPTQLVHIKRVDPALREIELDSIDAGFQAKKHLKLRRWDQSGENLADGLKADAGWVGLEGGVEVKFSDGQYRAGDYWLIPARTATGDIEWPPFASPNSKPVPQPPLGTHHHYCRLALINVAGGVVSITDDCRKRFPALTEICAEDVCFDNSECQMPNVETVQDAIEHLCDENDLRFHNRHLHGWGIVCGLEVNCGPDELGTPRRHITVKPGYAIDCKGNDVQVHEDAPLDLMGMIEQYNEANPDKPLFDPNNQNGGEVCLYLTGDAERPYALNKYDPNQNTLQSILKGTLLMDFYKECIERLVNFVRDEFTAPPEESKLPVGPTQKRITTVLNLLVQFVNPSTGQYVFLSGEQGQEDPQTEDTILRNFYLKLLALLQSHTFCAMFEDARPFPDYPFRQTDMHTLFGKNFHTRLRVHPQGKLAFTVGSNNKINVFDLTGNEMVSEVEFPGGTAAIVQDVAFSADGRQLYAIGLLNNKDTMFAVADINPVLVNGDFILKWRTPTVICDVLLVSLATVSQVRDKVFAIGKGKGLYAITPANVNATPQPMYGFNAVGHLCVLDQTGRAYATANAPGASSDEYDRVLNLLLLDNNQGPPLQLTLAGVPIKGTDGIAVATLKNKDTRLYVIVNGFVGGSSNKHLIIADAQAMRDLNHPLDLGEDTDIRLAFNPTTQHLMLTYEDQYHVRTLTNDEQLDGKFRLPVQIDPIDIAAPDGRRIYVLNHTSNTITSVQAARVDTSAQLDLEALAAYRRGIIDAFTDLIGGLLQYLKDCFCDHLLIRCPPECQTEDKLYLACISIKREQVFKVCNFSQRKYVKSFPSVDYWLSLFPVMPFINRAVEIFCCSVLPSFFGRFSAPQTEQGGQNRLKGATVRKGMGVYRQTNFRSIISDQLGKFKLGGNLLTDAFTRKTTTQVDTHNAIAPPPPIVKRDEVVGRTVDEAKIKLESNQIVVHEVQQYDPSKGATNLIRLAEAPNSLQPGANVTLYEENGVVKYYAPAEDIPAPLRTFLRDEIKANTASLTDTASREDVVSLRGEIADVQKRHDAALAERDNQIATLRGDVQEFASSRQTLTEAVGLRQQVVALQQQLTEVQKSHVDALAARDTEIINMKASLQKLTADEDVVRRAAGMQDEVTGLRTQLDVVQKSHQEALASRDAQIAQLQATTQTFQTNLQSINELRRRLEGGGTINPRPGPPIKKEGDDK